MTRIVDDIDHKSWIGYLEAMTLPLRNCVVVLSHARVLILLDVFHVVSGVPSSVPVPYNDIKSFNFEHA
jgi:hypothetical protein